MLLTIGYVTVNNLKSIMYGYREYKIPKWKVHFNFNIFSLYRIVSRYILTSNVRESPLLCIPMKYIVKVLKFCPAGMEIW